MKGNMFEIDMKYTFLFFDWTCSDVRRYSCLRKIISLWNANSIEKGARKSIQQRFLKYLHASDTQLFKVFKVLTQTARPNVGIGIDIFYVTPCDNLSIDHNQLMLTWWYKFLVTTVAFHFFYCWNKVNILSNRLFEHADVRYIYNLRRLS